MKTCAIPPDGEALWKRVESLLGRRDGAGHPLVARIASEDALQALLARELGRPYEPGSFSVCPSLGYGLLVGYPREPRAILHRAPLGAVHLAGIALSRRADPGAEIDRIVASLEVDFIRRTRR